MGKSLKLYSLLIFSYKDSVVFHAVFMKLVEKQSAKVNHCQNYFTQSIVYLWQTNNPCYASQKTFFSRFWPLYMQLQQNFMPLSNRIK